MPEVQRRRGPAVVELTRTGLDDQVTGPEGEGGGGTTVSPPWAPKTPPPANRPLGVRKVGGKSRRAWSDPWTMPGPPPSPTRRSASKLAVEWHDLPLRRLGRPPKPPVPVPDEVEAVWREYWKRGVATRWRAEDHWPLLRLVQLQLRAQDPDCSPSVLTEVRRLEDALGVSVRGRRENRWRYPGEFGLAAEDADADEAGRGSSSGPGQVVKLSRRGA